MSKKKYYIVSVRCQEVKAYTGAVMQKHNAEAWLGESDGYPAVSCSKNSAKHFDHIPTKREIAQYDGMPWWYRFIPDSEKIYEIQEEIICNREEREIE